MFDSDLVLCCVDYSREQVLGNITNRSVYDVWDGPVAREIRRRYLGHEFDSLRFCGQCKIDEVREVATDVDGTEAIGECEVAEEANGWVPQGLMGRRRLDRGMRIGEQRPGGPRPAPH